MNNSLAVVEGNLKLLKPKFTDVLRESNLPVERLMRTVMISIEKLPPLLDCSMDSIMSAAMTAAVLGLEVDGVTGQGYLIPFKRQATFVIGYKGFNTIAARSGYSVNAAVVRRGDLFEFLQGTEVFLRHRPSDAPKQGREITHAWAVANSNGRPALICVLTRDDIEAVRAKSPGARKADSPWNDPLVGYPAMAEKTARRRLARSMPLNVMQLAAAYDAAQDLGLNARLEPAQGLVIDGAAQEPADVSDRLQPEKQPSPWRWRKQDGTDEVFEGPEEWEAFIVAALGRGTMSPAAVERLIERATDTLNELMARDDEGGAVARRVHKTLLDAAHPAKDGTHGE